jgi:hypothetical protein
MPTSRRDLELQIKAGTRWYKVDLVALKGGVRDSEERQIGFAPLFVVVA